MKVLSCESVLPSNPVQDEVFDKAEHLGLAMLCASKKASSRELSFTFHIDKGLQVYSIVCMHESQLLQSLLQCS